MAKEKCYHSGISITGDAQDVLMELEETVMCAVRDSFQKLSFILDDNDNTLELWGVPPETTAEKEAKKEKRRKQYEKLRKEFG